MGGGRSQDVLLLVKAQDVVAVVLFVAVGSLGWWVLF